MRSALSRLARLWVAVAVLAGTVAFTVAAPAPALAWWASTDEILAYRYKIAAWAEGTGAYPGSWDTWFTTNHGKGIPVEAVSDATGLTPAETVAGLRTAESAVRVRGVSAPSGASYGSMATMILMGWVAEKGATWVRDHVIGQTHLLYGDGSAAGNFDWLNPQNWDNGPVYTYHDKSYLFGDASWDDELDWLFNGWTEEPEPYISTANDATWASGEWAPSFTFANQTGVSNPNANALAGLTGWYDASEAIRNMYRVSDYHIKYDKAVTYYNFNSTTNTSRKTSHMKCMVCNAEYTLGSYVEYQWSQSTSPYRWVLKPTASGDSSATIAFFTAHSSGSGHTVAAVEVAPVEVPWPSTTNMPAVDKTQMQLDSEETTPAALTVGDLSDWSGPVSTVPVAVSDNAPDGAPGATTDGQPRNVPSSPGSVGSWVSNTWADLWAPLAGIWDDLGDFFWPFHFMADSGG